MDQALANLYDQIDEQRDILVKQINMGAKNPLPANMISETCMKLSILNGLLGDHVVRLKQLQLVAEQTIYHAYEGKSASAAANEMRVGSIDERTSYQTAEMRHNDLWKLISMAQTHIRAETEERRNG